tara:strand:+ start:2450 stop:3724 length:1275 start_codon:yes stop_codon:yes gene_type:complete
MISVDNRGFSSWGKPDYKIAKEVQMRAPPNNIKLLQYRTPKVEAPVPYTGKPAPQMGGFYNAFGKVVAKEKPEKLFRNTDKNLLQAPGKKVSRPVPVPWSQKSALAALKDEDWIDEPMKDIMKSELTTEAYLKLIESVVKFVANDQVELAWWKQRQNELSKLNAKKMIFEKQGREYPVADQNREKDLHNELDQRLMSNQALLGNLGNVNVGNLGNLGNVGNIPRRPPLGRRPFRVPMLSSSEDSDSSSDDSDSSSLDDSDSSDSSEPNEPNVSVFDNILAVPIPALGKNFHSPSAPKKARPNAVSLKTLNSPNRLLGALLSNPQPKRPIMNIDLEQVELEFEEATRAYDLRNRTGDDEQKVDTVTKLTRLGSSTKKPVLDKLQVIDPAMYDSLPGNYKNPSSNVSLKNIYAYLRKILVARANLK